MTIILLLTLTAVSSAAIDDDSNTTSMVKGEVKPVNDEIVKNSAEKVVKSCEEKPETNSKKEEETSEYDSDEDCSSSIIHISDKEGAISFRRDNDATTTIRIGTNGTLVKQYKTMGSYFVHMMASSNGWFIGSGGLDGEKTVRNVERETLNMIKSDKYSQASINKLLSYKKTSSLAHLNVKSPDGHYFVYQNYYGRKFQTSGILKPGEFISVPNDPKYFRKGEYVKYTNTKDVQTASRIISAMDKYGKKRRNIVTFYYKSNGITSTINVTVANDNGRYVGLSTSGYRDNVQVDDRYISAAKIPVLNKYMYLKTFKFQLRKAKTSIQLDDIKLNDASMILKARVTDELGGRVNSGQAYFTINGKPVLNNRGEKALVNVKNGEVSLKHYDPAVLKNRVNTYTAVFVETGNMTSSSSSARLLNDIPRVTMTVNRSAVLGKIIHITADITYADKSRVKDGTAIIKVNGKTLTKANGDVIRFTIRNGRINYLYKLPLKFPQDNVTVAVEYTGRDNRKVTASGLMSVSRINPKIQFVTLVANSKLLKVRAKLVDDEGNKVRINSKVSLKINGQVIRKITPDNMFDITNGILSFNYYLNNVFKKGNCTLTVESFSEKYTNAFKQNVTFKIV